MWKTGGKYMRNTKRVIAIVLAVLIVASLLATAAFAASQKKVSGTGGTVTVDTGKPSWWEFWKKPSITIKNTGSRTASIQIYDKYGRLVANLTSLKAGKSHTFNLGSNSIYSVAWSTHPMSGGKVSLTIAEKNDIDYIK